MILKLASSAASGASTYLYDPLGARKRSTVAGQVMNFVVGGGDTVAEYGASWATNLVTIVRGVGDEVVATITYPAVTPPGEFTFYHNDRLGTPIAVSMGGVVTATYTSPGAFGEPAGAAGPLYRYTGQRFDAETGFYYLRARHYSPALGRFLQNDPIGYAGGANLYAYANNDPINLVDPSGMAAQQVANGAWNAVQDIGYGVADLASKFYSDPLGTTGSVLNSFPGTKVVSAAGTGATGVMAVMGSIGKGAERSIGGLAAEISILRDAARGKGNFGLGQATAQDAARLGASWVGPGHTVASDGKTLISADGLRQFRPPSFKPQLGIRGHFESPQQRARRRSSMTLAAA